MRNDVIIQRPTRNHMKKRAAAVVVFSGGQDSTTCLIQALHQYDDVHCITFDYGQRHRAEIEVAQQLSALMGIRVHKIIDLNFLKELAISSLTRDNLPIKNWDSKVLGLPNTFVPGRNILFLTVASIYSYLMQAEFIISGIGETDFSGYPDCRNEFIKILNNAIVLGIAREIRFETPLMWLNKAEIWALADYWKQLPLIRNQTLTCYKGIRGDGCGNCASCYLRAKGLKNYHENSEAVMQSMKNKIGLK